MGCAAAHRQLGVPPRREAGRCVGGASSVRAEAWALVVGHWNTCHVVMPLAGVTPCGTKKTLPTVLTKVGEHV